MFESPGGLVKMQILMQGVWGGPESSQVTLRLLVQEIALGSRVLGSGLHEGTCCMCLIHHYYPKSLA